VSSLYHCKARVLYKPFGSNKAIVFDERQIAQLSVNLSWQPNPGIANAQGASSLPIAASALANSTCQVTLTDPYLTGIAWPVLYDAASVYTTAYNATAAGILLRPCGKGENPLTSDCYPYVDIDKNDVAPQEVVGDYAHLLISLWYEIGSTVFGSDYYFRVTGMSVKHGMEYPSVTISGTEARAMVFNQTLASLKFDQGSTVNENLQRIAKEAGYQINFCKESLTDGYKIPSVITERGSTLQEALMRNINAVGGNMLSLPMREYANQFSVCTRADVQQVCTVFYLGKGLYEGYEISGNTNANFATNNRQYPGQFSSGSGYTSEAFKAEVYEISDITPKARAAKMSSVKLKPAFPLQFDSLKNRIQDKRTTGGWVWRGSGPTITPEQVENTNLYGVSPNGTKAVSYLKGYVVAANEKNGSVEVETEFFLQVCTNVKEDSKTKKCFSRPIHQETLNLTGVKVKAIEKLEAGQEIGSSTNEKKEYTRFTIKGYNNDVITVAPEIVWKYAVSKEGLTDKEKEEFAIKSGQTVSVPSPAELTGAKPSEGAVFIGKVGSTGGSSGPHVHIQESLGKTLSENQLIELAGKYVLVDNVPLTSYPKGDGFGAPRSGHLHAGVDYPIAEGKEIKIFGTVGGKIYQPGGCGNGVYFVVPGGKELLICHIQNNTIPPNIQGQASTGSSSGYNPSVQTAPTTQGLNVQTAFMGVPKALRLVPGRTILSFITDYDQWVEQGRPANADPNVLIPDRFRSWFITAVKLQWSGNLRVNVTGVSDWGASPIKVPRFEKYLEDIKQYDGAKITNSYFDYIRSPGHLCYRVNGQDSCSIYCDEAQKIQSFLTQGQPAAGVGSGGVPGAPVGKCQYRGSKYPNERVNKILNAAYASGIKTKEGLSGVVGNALVESTVTLDPTIQNKAGGRDFGVFQWNDRRPALEKFARDNGADYKNFDLQMSFFRFELGGTESATISAMKSVSSPEQAAQVFMNSYERPSEKARVSSIGLRQQYAREIFNETNCQP
jgi:hypothetical protein